MTVNRDTANEIYEPVHRTRTVSSPPETVPTGVGDGESCQGFNFLVLSTALLSGATAHQFELYLWDGQRWKLVEDSSTLTVPDDFDPAADFEQPYVVTGWLRFRTRIVSATGGNLQVTENLSV